MRALILSLALVAFPAKSHVVVVQHRRNATVHVCSYVIAGFAPPTGPGLLEATCEHSFGLQSIGPEERGPWKLFINNREYSRCRLQAQSDIPGGWYYQFVCK
jgi:hypothetical protein